MTDEYAPVYVSKCISILINITLRAVQNIFPIYGALNVDMCEKHHFLTNLSLTFHPELIY